jgi:serine/threonine protein phosphatase PrpC
MNHGECCPTFGLDYAQLSDLGMRRSNNQDSLAIVPAADRDTWAGRGHLMMVADGMGAHAAGELASKLAVDNVTHSYFKLIDLYPPAALRQAIRDANALIHTRGQSSIGFQGMGTTCTCLVLLPQGALVAHVGDSRVYRLRGHQLAQLTFDHSLVWEMAAAGRMAEEDVPAYIPKNVITRSLGPHENVNIDLEGPYDAQAGDVFLLCSDGLTGQVPDLEIGALLNCLDPQEAAQTLVDLANLRGGPDNISVVVARVGGEKPMIPLSGESMADTLVGQRPSRGRSLVLQAIGVAAILALAFCAVNEWWIASAVSGAVLVTTAAMLFVRPVARGVRCAPSESLGGPYGNGPYRQISCEPNRKVVESLGAIVAKLRGLSTNGSVRINWKPLDDAAATAATAADRGDFCSAIRSYSAGIRAVMQELRQHRVTVADDSGVYRT